MSKIEHDNQRGIVKITSGATPTANGELTFDGTNWLFREGDENKTLGGGGGGRDYSLITAHRENSAPVSDTTTPTVFQYASAPQVVTIPAGTLAVGDVIHMFSEGELSREASGSVTLTLGLYTKGNWELTRNLPAFPGDATGFANKPWSLSACITVLYLGVGASVIKISAQAHISNNDDTTVMRLLHSMVSGEYYTTKDLLLGVSVTWSNASAANSIYQAQLQGAALRVGGW